MSSFTEVVNPANGRVLSFKCGWDNCGRYNVGDTVQWRVFPDIAGAGELLDDVYDGEEYYYVPREDGKAGVDLKMGGRFWVIIKDHVILPLVPFDIDETTLEVRHGFHEQYCRMRLIHGVVGMPLDSWTEAAWAKEAKRAEQKDRDECEWEGRMYGKTSEERFVEASRQYLHACMKENGIIRKILPPISVVEPTLVVDGPVKVLDAESLPPGQ